LLSAARWSIIASAAAAVLATLQSASDETMATLIRRLLRRMVWLTCRSLIYSGFGLSAA
jgi:hypothetical protein